jgi:hypothetical protein
MAWTKFMDMHSGGGTKTDYESIYIEAGSKGEAIDVFEEVFDQHPYEVACGCCGENFSVSSYETLKEATKYERKSGKQPLKEYLQQTSIIKVIYKQGE